MLKGLVLAEAGLEKEAASATTRATDMLAILEKVRNAAVVWWYQVLTYHRNGDGFSAKRARVGAQRQVARTCHPVARGIEKGFNIPCLFRFGWPPRDASAS